MKIVDVRELFAEHKNSTLDLGENYAATIYSCGNIANLLMHDRPFVQIRFIADTMEVYRVVMVIPRSDIVRETKENILVHFPNAGEYVYNIPHMTCTLGEDIAVLSDIVPLRFFFLLREYKPRNRFINYLYRLLEA